MNIEQARIYAAKVNREIAAEAFTADYYADHVTVEKRQEIKERNIKLAEEIERGEHDGNFTVAQRMHYFQTGECPALLP